MKNSNKISTELERFVSDFFEYDETEEYMGEDWNKKSNRRKDLFNLLTNDVGFTAEIDYVQVTLVKRNCDIPEQYFTYCEAILKIEGPIRGFVKLLGQADSWHDRTFGDSFYHEGFTEVKPKTITKVIFEAV